MTALDLEPPAVNAQVHLANHYILLPFPSTSADPTCWCIVDTILINSSLTNSPFILTSNLDIIGVSGWLLGQLFSLFKILFLRNLYAQYGSQTYNFEIKSCMLHRASQPGALVNCSSLTGNSIDSLPCPPRPPKKFKFCSLFSNVSCWTMLLIWMIYHVRFCLCAFFLLKKIK